MATGCFSNYDGFMKLGKAKPKSALTGGKQRYLFLHSPQVCQWVSTGLVVVAVAGLGVHPFSAPAQELFPDTTGLSTAADPAGPPLHYTSQWEDASPDIAIIPKSKAPNGASPTATAEAPASAVPAPDEPMGEPAPDKTVQTSNAEPETRSTPATPATPKPATPNAKKPLTILDIQPGRQFHDLEWQEGSAGGKVTLTNLNPNIKKWMVLRVQWPVQNTIAYYHLENTAGTRQAVRISPDFKEGLMLTGPDGKATPCPLWSGGKKSPLRIAREVTKPYVSLCDGRLYLRNRIEGYRTTKEWIVEFLREKVWGGEAITSFVKETVYKDAYLITAEAGHSQGAGTAQTPTGPLAALIRPEAKDTTLVPKELGLPLPDEFKNAPLKVGQWVPIKGQNGIYTSVIEPEFIDADIMASYPQIVKKLDNVENTALSYLVAFDLSQFNLQFALGTDHPRVDWSERTLPEMMDKTLPGPDGIGTIDPLVVTGMLTPEDTKTVAATFTGGFKRSHSAFRWGALAKINKGSHYGVIENGVVFSNLQPHLATLLIMKDGTVDMKTWTKADDIRIPDILHARQNGVPVIDYDEAAGKPLPGKLVSNWTHGNWSGSQDMKFRSLRAGVCLQESQGKKYLIYAYFSSVTPSAMARIFQAYQCRYGFHLDMNALEHTYLALYQHDKELGPVPQHLITGMKVLDERFKGNIPRFIGYPDNRDFFFLTRRQR